MIRLLQESDIETICNIINDNWKRSYNGYVNEELLNEQGCLKRSRSLKQDFLSKSLLHYVYECDSQPVGILSIGDTTDHDKAGAFELWRIYISELFQGQGIGGLLLSFAEQEARKRGYKEMVIWAFAKNARAVSFYMRHGYTPDKESYLGYPYLAYGTRLSKKLSERWINDDR